MITERLTGQAAQGQVPAERLKVWKGWFVHILKEPLVHFLFLGFLLFAGFDIAGGGHGTRTNRIVIDDGVVADIVQNYVNIWQRPPAADELRGLLDNYVREEILYRQGVAMGLQDDDSVVRRRVRQKMDVIGEESEAQAPPTDAQLQAYLREHAGRYALAPLLSFQQVFVDPSRHGDETQRVVDAAKAKLAAGVDPASVGDVTMLPASGKSESLELIGRDFGEEFVEMLAPLPAGQWEGPIRSSYGLHLVRITTREAGRMPELSEVRQAVQRDWESDRRNRAADEYYGHVRKDYKVVVTADLPGNAKPEAQNK